MKTAILAAIFGLTYTTATPPEPPPVLLTPEAQMELQAIIGRVIQERDQALAEKEYWYLRWKKEHGTCI